MNRRATYLLAAGIASVVIVIIVLVAQRRTAPVTDAEHSAPDVPTVAVAFGPYTVRARAQGRVGPPAGGEAKLAFAGSGIIANMYVHVGEIVSAGDALARLDTSGFAIDVAQARADASAAEANYGGGSVPQRALVSAQAKLSAVRSRLAALQNGTGGAQSDREAAQAAVRQSQAKVDADTRALDREQALYSGGVAALKDVEAARQTLALDQADAQANRSKLGTAGSGVGAALTQARADVAQAESDVRAAQAQTTVIGAQAGSAGARLSAAQRNLANATLRAPAGGVVTAILKHVGEAADPTQPAITVGPPSSNGVTLTIGGDVVGSVHAGEAVALRIPGRNLTGTGEVRSVVPSVDPVTQTSTVVVAGVPAGAAPGDAVEATIDVGVLRGIVIPTAAIVEDPQTGKAIVFVRQRQKDGSEKFVSREIVVKSGDDRFTLVSEGLKPGERIASQGAFDLLAPAGGG